MNVGRPDISLGVSPTLVQASAGPSIGCEEVVGSKRRGSGDGGKHLPTGRQPCRYFGSLTNEMATPTLDECPAQFRPMWLFGSCVLRMLKYERPSGGKVGLGFISHCAEMMLPRWRQRCAIRMVDGNWVRTSSAGPSYCAGPNGKRGREESGLRASACKRKGKSRIQDDKTTGRAEQLVSELKAIELGMPPTSRTYPVLV